MSRSTRRLAAPTRWLPLLALTSLLLGLGCRTPGPTLTLRNGGEQAILDLRLLAGDFEQRIAEITPGAEVAIELPATGTRLVELRWIEPAGQRYARQDLAPLLATGKGATVKLAAGHPPLFRRSD